MCFVIGRWSTRTHAYFNIRALVAVFWLTPMLLLYTWMVFGFSVVLDGLATSSIFPKKEQMEQDIVFLALTLAMDLWGAAVICKRSGFIKTEWPYLVYFSLLLFSFTWHMRSWGASALFWWKMDQDKEQRQDVLAKFFAFAGTDFNQWLMMFVRFALVFKVFRFGIFGILYLWCLSCIHYAYTHRFREFGRDFGKGEHEMLMKACNNNSAGAAPSFLFDHHDADNKFFSVNIEDHDINDDINFYDVFRSDRMGGDLCLSKSKHKWRLPTANKKGEEDIDADELRERYLHTMHQHAHRVPGVRRWSAPEVMLRAEIDKSHKPVAREVREPIWRRTRRAFVTVRDMDTSHSRNVLVEGEEDRKTLLCKINEDEEDDHEVLMVK